MAIIDELINALTPPAEWTDDCGGKKDYDGHLISISTRYWPPAKDPNGMASARSSILLRHGRPDEGGETEYIVLKEQEFQEHTEESVKAAVEIWVRAQMQQIIYTLIHNLPGIQIQ
jgi:hypothetical protein